MKILIVEDDEGLREGLVELIGGQGHEPTAVGDGAAAVELGTREPFDLVLLDLMLPGLDGEEVCRRLRMARPDIGILMLTARGEREDKVQGLQAGADDYVAKPFDPDELLARISALGRRLASSPSRPELLEVDGCSIDLGRLQCSRGEQVHTLTPREVGILRWLHRHSARAVTRSELLENVWGVRGDLETRTVDAAIVKLRQKVEQDTMTPRIIVSVHGVGYAWGEE